MSEASVIRAAIQSASRRRLFVSIVHQVALALAIIFAAGALMLLAGTQVLNGWWLALAIVAGVAVTSVRVYRRWAPQYRVAQILDHNLELNDSLSTAYFLLSPENGRDDAIARCQLQQAAQAAARIQSSRAFPFRGHRMWALTGALACLVFGLFTLRYMVTRSLSLKQALIPISFANVIERFDHGLFPRRDRWQPISNADEQASLSQRMNLDRNARDTHVQEPPRDANNGDATGAGEQQAQTPEAQRSTNPQAAQSPGKQTAASAGQKAPADKTAQASNAPSASEQENAKEQSGQQGSSGLMDKMKDALSSLMAKMRPAEGGQKTEQAGQRSPQHRNGGDQNSANKDRQSSQQAARNDQAKQENSTEGHAQGQTTEQAGASRGSSTDKSPEKGSDAQSGVGRQDGDKALKEAEQLQAMGKLAEIIGKRSANVTGEMMVETPSGKQQLKTAYSHQMGHHADLGGEINRDEIPLAYQQYIREYMELVRKQGKSAQ